MDAGPEYESRLGNATVRMNGRMVGVAAGQILERGMLVTLDGPAVPAGPGAVRGTVGVLENDSDNGGGGDREVEVLGSGTVICVKAGADIRVDQTRLKAWKGGTVAPMWDGEDAGLWVASVRGNTQVGGEDVRGTGRRSR